MTINYFGIFSFYSQYITPFLLFGLLSFQITLVTAGPTSIQGSVTTLESDAVRMISTRHQEHMWETSDGAIHVVINQGSLSQSNSSLVLFSSFDNGQSWIAAAQLDDTDEYSTSDGILTKNNLLLAYSAVGGKILFAILAYDSTLQTWSINKKEVVFASNESTAINPAIAIDTNSVVWCTFTHINNVTQEASIKLAQRNQTTKAWQDTGLIIGTTDNDTQFGERSARPIAISQGIGMVYTVHEDIYWAYRLNSWPVTDPWITQLLYRRSIEPAERDPYGSHFSIAADDAKNLHLALVDDGQLKYLRFVNKTMTWNPIRTLSNNIKATYPQVTIAQNAQGQNTLVIFINKYSSISVLQSKDKGKTFTNTNTLTHQAPPAGSNLDYSNPRIETPGKSSSPIPVFQQFLDGTIERLMYFLVPVI